MQPGNGTGRGPDYAYYGEAGDTQAGPSRSGSGGRSQFGTKVVTSSTYGHTATVAPARRHGGGRPWLLLTTVLVLGAGVVLALGTGLL